MFTKSGPVDPVFIAFIIPKYFKKIRKYMGTSFKNILFLHIWTSKKCQMRKRRAPKNDEDPFKNFLKILNMGPIST